MKLDDTAGKGLAGKRYKCTREPDMGVKGKYNVQNIPVKRTCKVLKKLESSFWEGYSLLVYTFNVSCKYFSMIGEKH